MPNMSKEKVAWIAITGTIASGKSTLCRMLKEKGFPVLDCDAINRELLQKGNLGYIKVVETFGKEILNEQEKIESSKLAQIIFNDPNAKLELEQIMHPLILNEINQAKQKNQTITFVEVPLLFEVGWETYFDETWCVVVDDEVLIERAIKRGMNKDDVLRRMAHQMPAGKKRKKATIVIENNGDELSFKKQIEKEVQRLWQMNKSIN